MMGAEALFYELADLADIDRRLYYERNDIALDVRAEVESLIAQDRASKFALAEPVLEAARLAVADMEASHTPARCGPYQLKELIGSGGMGSVYRAERADGEVRSQVAVKLIRSAGSDPAMEQRFLRERQILASLSHPNIARLVDAGHAADARGESRPYLVMEYVDGTPIDQWARNRPLRAVLQLFLHACDAVAYAHRQLIVHRDLKPGNILVTAEGSLKLLDFGIAKEINGSRTLTQMALFTPDFASPEQARGAHLSTATDIYSLGAVLYKVLTGRSPHQFEKPTPEGIQVAIAEGNVTAPSHFRQECHGDLEAIVLRALRKEPSERYASVDQFADDLRAFLEFRPIRARRGEALYRARKFLRRYWIPVAASAAVVASLGIGLIIAQRERRAAERRFAEVRGLAGRLLDVEGQIRNAPGSLGVRKYIVESVVRSLDGLSSEVRNDVGLRVEVAGAYRRVAEVQAQRSQSSFGLHREALASLEKAEMLLSEVRGAEPHNRAAANEWFWVESEIADRLYDLGQEEPSSQRAKQTADQLARYLEFLPASANQEALAVRVYGAAARSLLNSNRTLESLHYSDLCAQTAIARAGRLRTAEAQIMAARTLRAHGTGQRYAGELERALDSLGKAEALLPSDPEDRRVRRERSQIAYYGGLVLGEAHGLSLGRYAEASGSISKAIGLLHEMIAEDPSDVEARVDLAQDSLKLGQVLFLMNRRKALDTFEDGLRGLAAAPETNRYVKEYRAKLKLESSIALGGVGRRNEGRRRLEESLAEIRESGKNWPPKTFGPTSLGEAVWRAQAEIAAAEGRTREAITIYEDALRMIRADPGVREKEDLDNAFHVSLKLARIAELLVKAGAAGRAEAYRQERAELWRQWQARLPGNTFVARQLHSAVSR